MATVSKHDRLFSMQITRAELASELGTSPDTLFMKQVRVVENDSHKSKIMKISKKFTAPEMNQVERI